MTDIFSKNKRSKIMSKIGPRNTTQELFIRKLVYSMGFRFRLHRKDLPGKPDLVFSKYNKVIFVNGCFWHGHPRCSRSNLPETNRQFWKFKISSNKKRDKLNYKKLKSQGWDYLIIWQCEIKKKNEKNLRLKISNFLK